MEGTAVTLADRQLEVLPVDAVQLSADDLLLGRAVGLPDAERVPQSRIRPSQIDDER